MKRLEWWAEIIVWAGIACAMCVLVSGCAGYQAMVIERPPVAPPCGILVCEHWGPGKVDYDKDCQCSHKQSLEDLGI